MGLLSNNLVLVDLGLATIILFVSSLVVRWMTAKGPLMWPVLGILPSLFANIDRVYDWITESAALAGGTFRFRGMWFAGCRGVITTDPSIVEYILKTNFRNFPKGEYYRERFADFLGGGIFNADGAAWRDQRRAAAAEMHSPRFAERSADAVGELVKGRLLPLLVRLAGRPRGFDLQDLLLRLAFDNVCVAGLGVDPGCLEEAEATFARAFEEATRLSLLRFVVPPVVWKGMKVADVGTERRLRVAVAAVHEFAERTVRERRGDPGLEERPDMLSRLMCGGGFSDETLKDFCISFILAGRDTSSVALAWFFWLLHAHPRVERKVVEEIGEIAMGRKGEGEEDEAVVFSAEEVGRMEYLQAALTESLRLYPSVPMDFKEAAEDDVLPDGTTVRKGDRVVYMIYGMGRMEKIWGKDCREFRPERWIKDGGAFAGESAFKYAVFNAGPRLCLGKKFAYMQMKMVAAAVLLMFRVVVEDGQRVAPMLNTTLYMRNGLRVRLERRGTMT